MKRRVLFRRRCSTCAESFAIEFHSTIKIRQAATLIIKAAVPLMKIQGRERLPVTTFRCDVCGYLESFAIENNKSPFLETA